MTTQEKLEEKALYLEEVLASNKESLNDLDEDSDEHQDLVESINDMEDELLSVESSLGDIERGECDEK